MVHRDVSCIGRGLIDKREPAVATLSADPVSRSRLLGFSAVVLSPAYREVSISRMDRNALKLNSAERSIVFINPWRCQRGIRPLPYAPIIGKPYRVLRGQAVNENRVTVCVQPIVIARKRCPAIVRSLQNI